MATLTSVELGATGRYVDLGAEAALENLAPLTVLAYCRPTGIGGSNLSSVFSKANAASTAGKRLQFEHNSNAPRWTFCVPSTGTVSGPARTGASNSGVYNSWQHVAATWDGSLTGANVHVFVGVGADLAEISYTSTVNGTTAIASDAGEPLILMNRAVDLARSYVGDLAYVAWWDRVLSLAELQQAQNEGPLSVPSGLVLLWANEADLGPNAFGVDGRTTFVAGTLPPNTDLGGGDTVGTAAGAAAAAGVGASDAAATGDADGVATVTGVAEADGSVGAAAGSAATAGVGAADAAGTGAAAGSASVAGVAESIAVDDAFEGSSVHVAGSSVTGAGDDAVITLQPRVQESEVVSGTRWLAPKARVSGVSGFRPTFELTLYGTGAGKYYGYGWPAGRRMLFSYDGLAWTHFDTAHTIDAGAGKITFRHSTAFTSSPVFVAWSRMVTPTMVEGWVADWAATFPSLISSPPSATAFVVDTYSNQTDELGRTVPGRDLLAFKISDASLSPPAGQFKRTMLIEGGIHAGEDIGDLVLKAAVDFLLSSDAQAQNIRANFDIFVYPQLNVPGRLGGHWRGSFANGAGGADDANRHFTDTPPDFEIAAMPKAAMETDLPAVVQFSFHFHGDFGNKYGFYQETGHAPHDLFETAVEAYMGAIVDNGDPVSTSLSAWLRTIKGTQFFITAETGEPTPTTDAQLVFWGESLMRAVSDLLDADEIPGVFDEGVGTAAGAAAVAGVGAADVAADGSAAGSAVVTGVAESDETTGAAAGAAVVAGQGGADAAAEGDADGVAAVSGQAAATVGAVGDAAGIATADGEAEADAAAIGSSAGVATTDGEGAAVAAVVGAAAGVAAVQGQGADGAVAVLRPLKLRIVEAPRFTIAFPLSLGDSS